jgi:hypothetical protein
MELPVSGLVGPIHVPGNDYIPPSIPLYVGKVTRYCPSVSGPQDAT